MEVAKDAFWAAIFVTHLSPSGQVVIVAGSIGLGKDDARSILIGLDLAFGVLKSLTSGCERLVCEVADCAGRAGVAYWARVESICWRSGAEPAVAMLFTTTNRDLTRVQTK